MKVLYTLPTVVFGCILLAGCMSFNNGDVPVVNNQSVLIKDQPTIEYRVGKFDQKFNTESHHRGVKANRAQNRILTDSLLAHWQYEGLIQDYNYAGNLDKKPDYIITMSGYRDEEGSIMRSVICDLTFWMMPTSITVIDNLNIELQNTHTDKVYHTAVKFSETTWMDIVLLPALPIFWIGNNNAQNEASDYIYSQFKKQGAFQT
ncbi:MAG TPA: hypothetical protein QF753_20135 [Victivallales bacterium]|nr:hypothetical protein [Victivallales bacterium]